MRGRAGRLGTSMALALAMGLLRGVPCPLAAQSVDGALQGVEAPEPVADPAREAELDALTAEIGGKLRCPVCRQQSVTESSSRIARDMQALIRDMLIEGRTPEEIEAHFVEAYGPWILLQPPAEGLNLLVYALPAAAFLLGGVWIFLRMRGGHARTGGGPVLSAGDVRPRVESVSETAEKDRPGPEPPRPARADDLDDEDRAWLEAAVRGG